MALWSDYLKARVNCANVKISDTFEGKPVRIYILALVACLAAPQLGMAQSSDQVLTVGVKVAPPFVIKQPDGSYAGLSINLWQRTAEKLGRDYRFQETDLNGLLAGLQDGSLDVSVAATTVTAERESLVDFTHPFHTTGLTIAVRSQSSGLWSTIKRFMSWEFFAACGALVGLLLLVGFLLWLAERHKNKEMFGGTKAQGIGASFWWAAVTMTTVGYGDKAPTTLAGRLIGLVWMFTAIIIISSFTAAIATSLTVGQLSSSVRSVADLSSVRVATVSGSASATSLRERGIGFHATQSLDDALDKLENDQVDAVVYDQPIVKYHIIRDYPGDLRVLPNTFERQDYAIALPEGSTLREPINHALLEIIASDSWRTTLSKYLGEP
jgi:ABC-type amino acid transport substrate-binding protein